MSGYRLYFMTNDGHIEQAAEFECETDAEAMRHAQDCHDGRNMELWRGARMVAEVPKRQDA